MDTSDKTNKTSAKLKVKSGSNEPGKLEKEMKSLIKQIEELKVKRLEQLQQLRLGANSNLHQPARTRKEIARTMTKLRSIEIRLSLVEVEEKGK